MNALTQFMNLKLLVCVLPEDDPKIKVETCHTENCTNKQILI
jgi:hypothetical protein